MTSAVTAIDPHKQLELAIAELEEGRVPSSGLSVATVVTPERPDPRS